MPRPTAHAIVVLASADGDVATWPLSSSGRPGLEVVDELARLQLEARRLGWTIRLRQVCPELAELLALAGLSGQVGGQAEGREQLRVEEVVVPDDPAP